MSALALERRATPAVEDVEVPIPTGFRLESGDTLLDAHVQVRRVGQLDGPQIIALGGISAGRDVSGPQGWWRETIVTHGAVDLDQFGLIGIDFAPLCNERVRLAPSDQARLIIHALDRLRITRLHAFVGASYGGLVGLALAALAPQRLERLCVISAAHRQSAQALAWRGVQRRIVEFGARHGDAETGLALARQLAMITYRTPQEFEERFGAGVDAHGEGEVDRYLGSRGEAYSASSAPRRWLTLSESIDRALVDPATIAVPTTLAACTDDQLVPAGVIEELAQRLPNLRALHTFGSLFGHDAFLKEPAQIARIIKTCLEDRPHDRP